MKLGKPVKFLGNGLRSNSTCVYESITPSVRDLTGEFINSSLWKSVNVSLWDTSTRFIYLSIWGSLKR